jgi:hypothetical protein
MAVASITISSSMLAMPHPWTRAKPAEALRTSLDWLRRLTFAELKTMPMFAIEKREGGAYLVLRAPVRFELPSSGHEAEAHRENDPIRLQLGPDDAGPFEHTFRRRLTVRPRRRLSVWCLGRRSRARLPRRCFYYGR